jgi:hypothetical protein
MCLIAWIPLRSVRGSARNADPRGGPGRGRCVTGRRLDGCRPFRPAVMLFSATTPRSTRAGVRPWRGIVTGCPANQGRSIAEAVVPRPAKAARSADQRPTCEQWPCWTGSIRPRAEVPTGGCLGGRGHGRRQSAAGLPRTHSDARSYRAHHTPSSPPQYAENRRRTAFTFPSSL